MTTSFYDPHAAPPDVRFGFIFDYSAPLRWCGTEASWWRKLTDLAREVEGLGYDTIWTAEHHFAPDTFGTSPLLNLALLAEATTSIRLGTYVLLLPLHHPVRVAEEAAAVDVLSDGRLELGLGIGFREEEFEGFGVRKSARPSLLEEGISILRACWSGGPVTHHGRHYSLDLQSVMPRPVQDPHPPIWLAARAEAPARRAGARAAHLHLLGGRTIRQAYFEAAREAGLEPYTRRVSIFKPIFVASDPMRELARYRPQFEYFTVRHATWLAQNPDIPYDETLKRTWGDTSNPLSGMQYLFGTPESCLAELRQFYQRKPFTDFISPIAPPYDIDGILASISLFAEQVMRPFKTEVRNVPITT
jgi:alkanesulfonate monooxygenase SsuD/methylene tetrahydromethanopterin reductase-like flavin-dependent oxidoreductase (luciferase family)